jgi:hypothetical protein
MAFGRGAYGPLSNTFNEISRMMEREQIRKADHEARMEQINLQNKQFEAQQAQAEYMRPIQELQVQQAQAQLKPVKFNLGDFFDPNGDPYNAAHISGLSDRIVGALNDGTGQWDPQTLDLVGVDGQPIMVPAHIAQRKMAGAFGTILAHTDPYKDKQRNIYLLDDKIEELKVQKPKKGDTKYAQGGFPQAELTYNTTMSTLKAERDEMQRQYDDPKLMKREYIEKLSEIEEMRGQLVALGAGDRVMGFLGEAADRYEKILGDLESKISGSKAGTDFERAYQQYLTTDPRALEKKTSSRWYFRNNVWDPDKGNKQKQTLKERAYTQWAENPANKGRTMLEFERDYAKFVQKGMSEGQIIEQIAEDSMMYDITGTPYESITMGGQPINNDHVTQLWNRAVEALTYNGNMGKLEALNRVKSSTPRQLSDGTIWLDLEDGRSVRVY